MVKNIKISSYQLICLMSGFMIGSTLIVNPVTKAQQDAWIGFLAGLFLGTIVISLYLGIARLNEGSNLVEIINRCFGKYFGKVICLIYIWYFIHLASLVLRNFAEFSVSTSYPETPPIFITVCFTMVIAFAVRSGIEVMGRISEIFVLILTAILLVVFIAFFREYDVENFKPLMSQGFNPILKTSFSVMSFPFGETVIFLMVFPYVNKQEKIVKATYISIGFVGVTLFMAILRNTMILGADLASRNVFPSHIVFRLLPGLDVDPLLDINMIVAGIIKVGICIFGAATGISELLGLKDYRPFTLPLSVLAVTLSIWAYSSLMEMINWANAIWPIYSIPFQIIIPVLLLFISAFKNNHQRNKLN